MSTEFEPTHRVPRGGTRAWANPDPSAPPEATLHARTELQIVERQGDWARARAANGWTGWVDGHLLEPVGPPSPGPTAPIPAQFRAILRAPRRITALPAIGAALILIGSSLPWISRGGGASVSAWDIPIVLLFTKGSSDLDLSSGVLLLVPTLACLSYLTRQPFPRLLVPILATIATTSAIYGFRLAAGSLDTSIGAGVVVTFLGGAVMAADYVVTGRTRP